VGPDIDFVGSGWTFLEYVLLPNQSQAASPNIIPTTTPHFSLCPTSSTSGDMGYLASRLACRDARHPSAINLIGVVRVTAV
jgi:hypothetical protein